jgi:hypothetical protein
MCACDIVNNNVAVLVGVPCSYCSSMVSEVERRVIVGSQHAQKGNSNQSDLRDVRAGLGSSSVRD